jgi:hypothetical protein
VVFLSQPARRQDSVGGRKVGFIIIGGTQKEKGKKKKRVEEYIALLRLTCMSLRYHII